MDSVRMAAEKSDLSRDLKEVKKQIYRYLGKSIASGMDSKMQVGLCLASGETARRPVQLVSLNYCDGKLIAPSASTIPPLESILNSEPERSLPTDILKSLYVCPFDNPLIRTLSRLSISF